MTSTNFFIQMDPTRVIHMVCVRNIGIYFVQTYDCIRFLNYSTVSRRHRLCNKNWVQSGTVLKKQCFKNQGVCFKIKLNGEDHASFPLQKCGVFQPVQTSFQAVIFHWVFCCVVCQCLLYLQSKCQALILQFRCDQVSCLGACTKIRRSWCIFCQICSWSSSKYGLSCS